MPYPKEHAARLVNPDKFDKIRRKNDAFGTGIHAIYGIKDGKSELQAIRFDSDKFKVAEARAWLKKHEHKPILFEPATGKEKQTVGADVSTALKQGAGFDFSKQPDFIHNHGVSQAQPDWKAVEIEKLPQIAFASIGDPNDGKTWKYPHHFVENHGAPDEHGHWTKGTLKVHTEGLRLASEQAKGDAQATRHLDDHWKTIDPDRDGHPLPDRTGINAHWEERSVPRYSFSAPAVMTLGDNGAGAVSAPIQLIALSGEILERPEWGPCIQDLSGLEHKDKIAIDYRHNSDQIVGYINHFEVMDGKLVLSGALVPQKTHCRTQEIIDNIKAGIPYEASVYFPPWKPDEMEIECIDAGKTTMVNGKTVTAPDGGLTVFRKWSLRGVAICPHGADGNTAAYLQSEQATTVNVRVAKATPEKKEEDRMNKQKVMELLTGISKETDAQKFMQALTDISTQAEDAEQKQLAVDSLAAINAESDPAKKSAIAAGVLDKFGFKATDDKDEDDDDGDEKEPTAAELAKKFAKKFGAEKGMEYLSKGMKYEDALEAFADEMKAAMEAEAETKAKQTAGGGARPRIRFSNTDDAGGGAFGLSEKEVDAIEKYAQEFGLTDKAKTRIMEKHAWARRESRRLGVYSPDPKADKAHQGATTLTKIGVE